MSIIHVRQIRSALEQAFESKIDLSDIPNASDDQRSATFLTRALAGFALMLLSGIDATTSASAITDGTDDNGIDAIYFHEGERVIYILQAKWHSNGSGTIQRGDAQKFITGFKDLLNARFERFNARFNTDRDKLEAALNDSRTRFVLSVVYTGADDLGAHVNRDFDDLLRELNDTTDIVSLRVLKQGNLYHFLAQGMAGAPIDLEVVLYEWGQVEEPYRAYYGQVAAIDVATWWNQHAPQIFVPNIRMFLGDTGVNDGVAATLADQPEHFWYFNNGITALCESITRKPIGGGARQSGVFECHNFTIVNGAQTAGAVARACAIHSNNLKDARVPLRIITLSHAPVSFAADVTRYNNTQNRIEQRDFVALDPEQERIRTELLIDGITYSYKSGDATPPSPTGFDLVEATVARACFQPTVNLAVIAKAAIGRLWVDIQRPPYRTLFNPSTSGPDVWKQVQVIRIVESTLEGIAAKSQGRKRLLAIHGNRFVAHLVALRCGEELKSVAKSLTGETKRTVERTTQQMYEQALRVLAKQYPDSYLASLFKNQGKSDDVKERVRLGWEQS